MIELNSKNETYYIDLSKVYYINVYIDVDGDYHVNINFGYDHDLYIACEDKQELDYIMIKLKSTQ